MCSQNSLPLKLLVSVVTWMLYWLEIIWLSHGFLFLLFSIGYFCSFWWCGKDLLELWNLSHLHLALAFLAACKGRGRGLWKDHFWKITFLDSAKVDSFSLVSNISMLGMWWWCIYCHFWMIFFRYIIQLIMVSGTAVDELCQQRFNPVVYLELLRSFWCYPPFGYAFWTAWRGWVDRVVVLLKLQTCSLGVLLTWPLSSWITRLHPFISFGWFANSIVLEESR